MSNVHYREAGPQVTTSASYVPMTNAYGGLLEFTHPANSGSLLVTLCVPNPMAIGHNHPGIGFGLMVNGTLSRMIAQFTSETVNPGATGPTPTTLVLFVGGGPDPLHIQAVWMALGPRTTAVINTYASLSGVIVDGLAS